MPCLLDFLPFDGYLILESSGMTCPPTTLTHTCGLDRHLAHAPNCWQHTQWYLQTLDFLLSCQVWRAVSPSKMALPICGNPRISIMSNMKSLIHLLSPAVAACRQKAWSKCLLFSVSGTRESAWRCHRWQGRSSGVIVGKLICKYSSENLFPSVEGYFGTCFHETKTPSIKCHLVH